MYKYINLVVLMVLLILSAQVQAGAPNPVIVNVDWLAQQMNGQQNLVIIDARLAEDYEMGHILGAVNIPYVRAFTDNFIMPGIKEVAELFSEAGIKQDSRVVVYGDNTFRWAARVYWLLEVYGHRHVSLLNVGFGDWLDGSLPISRQPPEVQRSNFVPTVDHRRLDTKLSTRIALHSPRHTILDGRGVEHYLGRESTAKRHGHIPGAINVPWSDHYVIGEHGNEMRPLNELAEMYHGLGKENKIIAYCTGGSHSAVNYIVLKALGYNVSVYDGSWAEWGNDDQVPIFNPSVE